MTTATVSLPGMETPDETAPRPGSRAARLAVPRAGDVLRDMATEYGVCVRPVTLRRTDLTTGATEVVDLPCGATREDKCPSCAKRALRLRRVQIREGWHRVDEPNPGPNPATEEQQALILLRAEFEHERAAAIRDGRWEHVADLDAGIDEVEERTAASGLRGAIAPPRDADGQTERPKRTRSTRRRQDAPDLPRQRVEARTTGRVYVAPDGTEHRPSMWLTLTLDSYGPVHSLARPGRRCTCGRAHRDTDPLLGTPVNPDTYDYRRAAWDAVHFPRLLDRFWQNLRRCVGWNVQYAGCVEPQRRLAPHAHFAIRGTVARAVLRQVAAATYHQVWWPTVDEPTYAPDRLPRFDATAVDPTTGEPGCWVDPDTGAPLPAWGDVLDAIDVDPDATPAHVVRFGRQVDARGVNPDSRDVDKTVRYITKYITKPAGDCHTITSDPQRDHLERLWRQLRVTPCSDRCANWLLYGIAPKNAHERLRPGNCKGRVHQRSTLGLGGRRVLISRDWSGKTLADHRADARAWVRRLLGVSVDHANAAPAGATDPGEPVPVAWELVRPDDPDVLPLQHRLLRSISERVRWRSQLRAAQDRAAEQTTGTDELGERLQ